MAVDPAFAAELEAVAGEVSQPQPQPPAQGAGPLETLSNLNKSVGGGILKSIFETKDFVFGETPEGEKSDIRRGVEQRSKELAAQSPINAVAGSIAQFATGMIGAGKLTAPLKGIQAVANAGKAAKVAGEIGKAAAVGAVVFDPHEDRLSNLIQQFPPLANPVSEYLAAKPTDSAAEGRFKNALESIGMDVAMLGVFKATMAGYKYLKAGNATKAEGSFAEAAKALEESRATELAEQGQAGAAVAEQAVRDQPKTVGELFNEFRARKEPQAETPLQRAQRFQEEQPKGAADEAQPRAEPEAPVVGDQPAPAGDRPGAGPGVEAGAPPMGAAPGLREGVTEAVPNLKAASAALPPGGAKPIPELPQETVPQLMAKVSGDVAALVRYGSREKAVSAGHSFGQGSSLPWQMWNTPEDVAAFAARIADEGAADLSKARGAMSDAALQRLVNQRVLLFNEKPDDIHGLLTAAGKNARTLAANMEASTAIGIKMTDEAMQVHAKIRAGNLSDFGGSYQAAMDEFGKRVGLSLEMLGEARSMLSGAGRALRRGRGDLERLSGSDLQKLEKLPVPALYQLFSEANGDLKAVARMLNKPGLMAQAVDLANFLRVNNLLWGWKTHVVNLASNAWMIAQRPGERLIGSAILQAAGKMDGAVASSMRTQAVREYRYTASVLADSLYTALRHWQATDTMRSIGRAFKQGDSVLSPHADEYFRQTGAATGGAFEWKPVAGIADLGNNALRALEVTIGLPTRTLGAADEMMKQISYRSVVMAEASMEADARGLSGAQARAHIAAKLDEAFDANGAAVNEAALKEAQVRTFQQDLLPDTAGAGVQHFKANHPTVGLILPFVKTPTNVLRYSVKLTPGLNLVQREYRDMISGRMGLEQQAQAVGQMSLGALILGVAASLTSAGVFTGSGPTGAKDKQNIMASGWQPNSWVRPNENGTVTYTPINRFDPVAMPFGIVSDLVNVFEIFKDDTDSTLYKRAEDAAGGLLLAITNQLKDRTYLQSLTQALQAANEPDKTGGKFAGGIIGSLVPGATLWKMLSSDPYIREVRGIVDGIMANTPGLSEKLEARRDLWGEPIGVRKGFSSSTVDRIVDNEMVRMGLDADQTFGPVGPSGSSAGDLRDFTLEDGRNAYSVLQELSARPKAGMKSLKEQAATLFQSPTYQKAIDGDRGTKGTKQWMLSDLLRKYREPAMRVLQSQSPRLREQMQEAELKARAAFATGQKDAKAAGDMKGLQALGSAYGVDLGKMFPGLPNQ